MKEKEAGTYMNACSSSILSWSSSKVSRTRQVRSCEGLILRTMGNIVHDKIGGCWCTVGDRSRKSSGMVETGSSN